MRKLDRMLIAGLVVLAGSWWLSRAAETAEAVLERYVEATGGRTAYDKIRNRVVHATLEIARQGIRLEMTVYAAKPNLFHMTMNSDLTGKIEQGIDGQVAWSKSVTQGPQLLEGEQKEALLREARLAGPEQVDGKPCTKVVLTAKSGKPVTLFLDEATSLLVRTDMVTVTEAGEVPMRIRLQDYREVDGLKLPHRSIIEALGQERVLQVNRIEHNVDLPADRFALPDDVKALLPMRQ